MSEELWRDFVEFMFAMIAVLLGAGGGGREGKGTA